MTVSWITENNYHSDLNKHAFDTFTNERITVVTTVGLSSQFLMLK